MQLSHRARGEEIAGQVKQLQLTDPQLLAEWSAVARETAAAVGVDSPEFLVDAKLLLAAPKRGLQSVHWDTARSREAHTQLACILACSSGASSTALPTFPTNDDLSFSSNPSAMRRVAHLLQPEHYASSPAQPGEAVLFRLSTPHFGVANTMLVTVIAIVLATLLGFAIAATLGLLVAVARIALPLRALNTRMLSPRSSSTVTPTMTTCM